MTKKPNRVSPEGVAIGAQMVRITEPWIARLEADGEPDERCKSCAFRLGTVPNGCLQTQGDVVKAVIEKTPFLCHQADRKGWPCHGWLAAVVGIKAREKKRGPMSAAECPWEFSSPDPKD